ncbi:Uu.00g053090.m01.CDS01 [Anthostomella pinea]|uniref:Uu.00g053090.m01.CDS01 n=1 Tax=Anthostomella pinea TaxID=933095 RepID=A0AAI8VWC9_9PEZI|nr:Uu.00g053090.m01.CDS01 [Anthostomella pinea]
MALRGLIARGVPATPKFLIYVKGAIILLSIIILALAAYAISLYSDGSYQYSTGMPGFLIFLAILSRLVYGISAAIELKAPRFYYRIVVLVAYFLTTVFWLAGWAWAASWAAYILSFNSAYPEGVQ